MPFQLQAIIASQFAPNPEAILYTSAVGVTTRIDSLVVTNTDTVTRTITIHLVPSGGSSGSGNITTDAQAVLPGQTWVSPNELGQSLNPGDFISVLASAANHLVIRASGLLQT